MTTQLARQLEARWESGDSSPDVFQFLRHHMEADPNEVLAVLLTDQRHRWRTEEPHRVEDYLARLPHLAIDPKAKLKLAIGEFQARQAAETQPNIDEYTFRFNDISEHLRHHLCELTSGDSAENAPFTSTASFITDHFTGEERLGRYRLERVLGEGAFGRVYLAFDEELQRQVAIKVPTAERFRKPEDADQYLAEARTVAGLNHPNIVPVYDMGRRDDGSIYVVSKFIEGCPLRDRVKHDRPSHDKSAKLIAIVARALHHAHERRLIHRDVKPGNILLEGSDDTPYVADFGLAIREEDYLKDRRLVGTPAYMSPEQARGEGHRLDGRSDIFSLGVVLYELLTSKRPFRGGTENELLNQVVSVDPLPPRQRDESIPAELERICLRALSKRASDRYPTAVEMAEDLLNWNLAPHQESKEIQIVPKGLRSFDADDAEFFLNLLPGPRNRTGLPESVQFWKARIEEVDPDRTFNVGLIYGPSGCGKSSLVKAGLLPRLSNDVTAIYVEATSDETETRILRGLRKSLSNLPQDLRLSETFSLLRRVAGKKIVIVLDQFEQWLHAHRANQATDLVAALRQCDGGSLQTVVLVRDDFWLAASRFMNELEVNLVQGENIALVDLFDVDHAKKVLVRFGQAFGKLPVQADLADDEQWFVDSVASGLAQAGKVVSVRLALFAEMVKGKSWVPATLEEVGGTEGIGVSFLEETFSSRTANPSHRLHQQAAREVLSALLPNVGSEIRGHIRSQKELQEAAGYQHHVAEFNDLLRILDTELRLITPSDTAESNSEFRSERGPKFYQLTHDYLVPSLRDWLTRKKRETRRGRAELKLAERSAFWNAKRENRQLPTLIEWLMIFTLTDSKHWTSNQRDLVRQASRFHFTRFTCGAIVAYLIFSGVLWMWQERKVFFLVDRLKQVEPNELLEVCEELDKYRDIAESHLVPLLDLDSSIDDNKKKLLHARLARAPYDRLLVEPLKEELLKGNIEYVNLIRERLGPDLHEMIEGLWGTLQNKGESQRRRTNAALALPNYVSQSESISLEKMSSIWALVDEHLKTWPSHEWTDLDLKYVHQQLESSKPNSGHGWEASSRALMPSQDVEEYSDLLVWWNGLSERSRDELERDSGELGPEFNPRLKKRLRMTTLEARLNKKTKIVQMLHELRTLCEFRPIDENSFTKSSFRDGKQIQDAIAIAFVARNDVAKLTESLLDATPKQFAVLYPLVAASPAAATKFLFATLQSGDSEAPGEKLAIAANALLRLGEQEKVLHLFRRTDNPEALTQFVFNCREHGIGVEMLTKLLQLVTRSENDGSLGSLVDTSTFDAARARYALLLALGEFQYAEIPESLTESLLTRVTELYADKDISSGVHSAAAWLLRHWGQEKTTRRQPVVPYSPNREWFTLAVKVADSKAAEESELNDGAIQNVATKTFYYTFIVFPKAEYQIGDLGGDAEPQGNTSRTVELDRFAVLDREITFEELIAFSPNYREVMLEKNDGPHDAGFGTSWYGSMRFCSWLGEQLQSEVNQIGSSLDSLNGKQPPQSRPLSLGRPGFRLPTEAEWEVAARGGVRTAYCFGEDESLLTHFGWYKNNSDGHVHPPREKRPNIRGLFDQHGNLFEWTDGDRAKAVIQAPNSSDTPHQAYRGGSFWNNATECRSTYRGTDPRSSRENLRGFRLALSLPGSSRFVKPTSSKSNGIRQEGASKN